MKSLMIKDLEISKELTREDLSAVRGGGDIFNVNNAQTFAAQYVAGASAGSFSPNTVTGTLTALSFNIPTNVSIG